MSKIEEIAENVKFAGLVKVNSLHELRLLFSLSMDAVISLNSKGLVIDWNSHAEKMFGWHWQEALHKPLTSLIIPKKFRKAHDAGIARYLETGEGPILNRRIEALAMHRMGSEFPIELSVQPLYLGTGIIFTGFIRDLTNWKEQEEVNKRIIREVEMRSKTLLNDVILICQKNLEPEEYTKIALPLEMMLSASKLPPEEQ